MASVGLAGLGARYADAGLMVDLYATSINGNTAFITDPKNVYFAVPGDTITLNIIARITGTNAVQTVGNFDGFPPATDTRNDDSMNSLVGAFKSVGGLKGNFDPGNQGAGNQTPPWFNTGAQNGASQDFDSDGDLDLGATGTDVTPMWICRGPGAMSASIVKKNTAPQTRFGSSASALFYEDMGAQNSGVKGTRIVDAATSEYLLGELTWIVTGATPGSFADINFLPRSADDAITALWFQDGIATGKHPGNASFGLGPPVRVGIPEPGGASLLGLMSLGLLARRKK